jgi:histone H3/H4
MPKKRSMVPWSKVREQMKKNGIAKAQRSSVDLLQDKLEEYANCISFQANGIRAESKRKILTKQDIEKAIEGKSCK